jgi:hypothetical protein
MWDRIKKAVTARQPLPDLARTQVAGQSAPSETTICCGEPMGQRLGRARDRLGQLVFVAVWHCPKCGRTRL